MAPRGGLLLLPWVQGIDHFFILYTQMKKIIVWVSLLVIVGLGFYFSYPYFVPQSKMNEEKPSAASSSATDSSVLPVTAVAIKPKAVEDKITVTGSVVANESVELTSEIAGKVTGIYFKEGSRVNKGDVLLSIEDDELSAQLERLKYQKKLFEEREFRQRRLLDKEAISQEEYDLALTELNTSEADVKLVTAQLAKTKIRAPFSGIVGLRYVSEGSYITPGNRIASLYNIDPIKIEFSIPGRYSSKVQVSDKVRFITESMNDYRLADIYAIEPQIDPATRTLRLRAICENKDNSIIPGQFVRIELIFESYDNAIMAPTEAVIPELGGHKVFLYRGGKAASVEVKVGIRTEREVEIVRGLAVQDTLITSGILQLTNGMDVSITSLN